MIKPYFLIFLMSGFLNLPSNAQSSEDTTLTVYFGSGDYKLDLAETEKLGLAFKNRHFSVKKISGHTDSVGSPEKNITLSQSRSRSVADYIQDHFNISKGYSIQNYGEGKPVSIINNALNRRVEIVVHYSDLTQKIKDTGRYTVIKIYNFDKIYFVPNQPIIESSSLPYLDEVVQILKSYPTEKFEIRGHVNWPLWSVSSNDSGYRRKMNQLSTDRARAVYDLLIEKGILPQRMLYRGMGNSQMAFPNARKKEEQLRNMRVEILILKEADSTQHQ
jgi:outer membrane protein OmpA-like peptidoglycan-associated protein